MVENKVDWDKRYLELAEYFATWSKDASRGVGAVIVNYDNRLVCIGYNGFPAGIDDSIEERYERPAKYDWTVHAEEAAIGNAARIGVSTYGNKMYLNLFPCARCAGLIIGAGINMIIVNKKPNFEDEKYGEEFKISVQKFKESGVIVKFIE